jgi:succinyl-diaminopimelate desuccinylase
MKGAVAAFLAVADAVTGNAPNAPCSPFSIVLTADEETGCTGMEQLSKKFPLKNVWGVILGEPTSNAPVTGHKGVVWVRVTLHGQSGHASVPELGDNAILKAVRFIDALNADFESQWQANYRHPDLGAPTLNIGKIKGGVKSNIIPDTCDIWLDFRVPPPLDLAFVQNRLEQILAEMGEQATFKFEPEGKYYWLPADQPLVRLAQEACGCPTGKEFPGFTEASLYQHDLNLPVVVLGPGSINQAHTADEFISYAELVAAVDIYQQCLDLFSKIT